MSTPDSTFASGDEAATGGPATPDDIMEVLRGVIDPELGADIVELGMAKGATISSDGTATVTVALTTMGCPLRAQIRNDIKAKVEPLPGITGTKIDWTELSQPEKAAAMARARKKIADNPPDTAIDENTRVLMISSGKGGVGKSSITTNLAAAIANLGFTVGVLDADIWGYSVPRMLGVDGRLEATAMEPAEGADPDEKPRAIITPNSKTVGTGELKVVSMGFLVDQEETALMWRGLMLNRAVQHFLEDVDWGYLDYLLIDMPPGTGDVQMGLAKMLPRAEMIIVTTPALAAQKVAVRAANMGRNNYLRVVGVVENMSAFVAPDGERYEIFGAGGGQDLADEVGAPLLAEIPIDNAVAAGGDAGEPAVLGDGAAAVALRALAELLVVEAAPPVDMSACSVRLLETDVAIRSSAS